MTIYNLALGHVIGDNGVVVAPRAVAKSLSPDMANWGSSGSLRELDMMPMAILLPAGIYDRHCRVELKLNGGALRVVSNKADSDINKFLTLS